MTRTPALAHCRCTRPPTGRWPGSGCPAAWSRADQLTALADGRDRFGSPAMELTSRGNIQIRGVTEPARAGRRGGRRRTVAVAEPRAGAQHRRLAAVRAAPAATPTCGPWCGPRWTAIQASAGAGRAARPVLVRPRRRPRRRIRAGRRHRCAPADGADRRAAAGRRDTGVRLPSADVVANARRDRRDGSPTSAELPGGSANSPTSSRCSTGSTGRASRGRRGRRRPGRRSAGSSRTTAGSPLAPRCPSACCRPASPSSSPPIEAPLVVTPWRSVLVCDLDEGVADVALRVLAPLGLVFDEDSPWLVDQRLHRAAPAASTPSPTSGPTPRAAATDPRRRAPPLRRLRAGVRQPARRRGTGGDRGRLPAATSPVG